MAATDRSAFALLDALFAHAPVGLAFWDAELRYRRINEALAAINGLSRDAHLGRTVQDVLGPLGDEVATLLHRVLRTGEPAVDVEMAGETPAAPGVRRTWLAYYYPVTVETGGIEGVGAVMLETTAERRAAERAVKAIRERRTTSALLDAVFAASPVGLCHFDAEGRYRRVNPALARLDGVPADEHLGRTPEEVLGERGRAPGAAVREVLATGEPVVDREIALELDGETTYRQGTWFPVRGADGEIAGVGAVVRDVSAQHASELERTRLLKEALTARAHAEAASVRAESARADAEAARRGTDLLARAGERLAEVAQAFDRTVRELTDVVVPGLAEWSGFVLREPHGQPHLIAASAPQPGLERAAQALALRALAADATVHVPTVAAADAELAHGGLGSALAVPLRTAGRPLGVLVLALTAPGHAYGADDVTLAESLATRAALALENARLLEERSHIARTLQRSLLPPALPDVAGADLAARYRAAGAQNEVGGDFYDVFRAGDGTWTFVIGDVSGKGAEAAAVTSLTRHTLRAVSMRESEPGEVLPALNDVLLGQLDPAGRFVTVLLGRVRGAPGGGLDVTLATGGHLPPTIVRAGGRVERLQLRGSIVGGLRTPSFGCRDVRLEAGDTLVMFTDGVTELRASDPDLGECALEEVLRDTRGAAVEDVVAAVEARAVELQDGEPRDDIALLALRAALDSDP